MLFKHLLLLYVTQVVSQSCDTTVDTFVEDRLPASGSVPPVGSIPGTATFPTIGTLNGREVGLRITAMAIPDRTWDSDPQLYTLDVQGTKYIAMKSHASQSVIANSGKVTSQLVWSSDDSIVADADVDDLPATFSDLDNQELVTIYTPTAPGSSITVTGGVDVRGTGTEVDVEPGVRGYSITAISDSSTCTMVNCPSVEDSNGVTLRFRKTSSFSFSFSGWGIVALQSVIKICPPTSPPPPSPPPPSPPSPPPFVGLQRDPHLFLAHGERTDFRGQDKTWYSMLSAKNTSVNVFFENADFHNKYRLVHGSFMGRFAMVVRTALTGKMVTIEFNATGVGAAPSRARVHADGVDKWVSHMYADYALENLKVVMREKKMGSIGHGLALIVSTGRWEVQVWSKPFPNRVADAGRSLLNLKIDATYDADHDSVAPHGIIGQSYDGDDVAVDGALDIYKGTEITTTAMGEGAIEGTADDYIMPNGFATSFKYSRFDAVSAKPRDVTKLTGTKTKRKVQHASTGATADVED